MSQDVKTSYNFDRSMNTENRHDPTREFLTRQGFLLLDGGLATEIERQGVVLDTDLWSASVLVDQPEILSRVHRDYLEAGADCLATASYQASLDGLGRYGMSRAGAESALARSVSIATEARDDFWADSRNRENRIRPLVAASIGPYGAYLADGSEYRGDYGLTEQELLDFHRQRWEILASAGADLMACETIPSRVEARALKKLIERDPGPPAWVSLSCRTGAELADGTSLIDTVSELLGTRNLVAVGVNCVAPSLIEPLVVTIRTVWQKPIVVYPNSGEIWNARAHRWGSGLSSENTFADVAAWYREGASLIGGCCRTGPDEIGRLRNRLEALARSTPG
jgi:homocysteine S-methyltransferase